MVAIIKVFSELLTRRIFVISWISLVIYLFYDTFTFYLHGRQFYHLREILGVGLCVSRGTATVLNLCCALVLLPLCKKLNLILSLILYSMWPGLFFFWLERAKSIHMTVAATLILFAVIHSISHLGNLWNFSRGYSDARPEINFASYKNESPLRLLMSQAGLTGVLMMIIILSMGLTSLRVVRRKVYNAFWYTHQLYMVFMVLLLIHPLSGALKEEVIDNYETTSPIDFSILESSRYNATSNPKFVPIKSKTWLWMSLPLSCFLIDLLWRVCSRNRARVDILQVAHMPGRTISLTMSSPDSQFRCRMGQYVLLQCVDLSLLEWHPFTIVKIPTEKAAEFSVWIRVKGDWTIALEKLLVERGPSNVRMIVDGPFSSPMEGVSRSEIAICVAAGVGITPFVSVLRDFFDYPRSKWPGRLHLIWIVRHESEISWLADLANRCILQLRNYNRPDRLQLEFYVTKTNIDNKKENGAANHVVVVNEKGGVRNVIKHCNDDKETLLTPNRKRNGYIEIAKIEKGFAVDDNNYNVAKEYPLLGCRVKRGRPHWDRVFGYWVHLYPEEKLNLYCCGPKTLVKLLKGKCRQISSATNTKIVFVHEGFS